jgi:phospholipase/carboxylesterase
MPRLLYPIARAAQTLYRLLVEAGPERFAPPATQDWMPQMQPAAAAPLALTHVHQPPRAAVRGAPPGLLLLHGRGADEHDLLGLAPALDPRLAIISARAPFDLGFGYHWYELLDIGRPEARTFRRALELLDTFSAEIITHYGLDPTQLYVLGFSQGAMMSGTLTLTRPERIAGTLALSGYLPLHAGLPLEPARQAGRAWFVAHGERDPVIPVGFGRESRDYLTAAGADLAYHEYPIPHAISDEELSDAARWLTARLDAAAPRI